MVNTFRASSDSSGQQHLGKEWTTQAMDMDDLQHRLTNVGRFVQRRAKRTKMFWLSCVPSGKRQNQREPIGPRFCDSETQTTPTIEESFCFEVLTGTENTVQMPAVDSSRDSLDSNVFTGSSESLHRVNGHEWHSDKELQINCEDCSCVAKHENEDSCKCPMDGFSIMDKLLDLQQEIAMIREALSSLKSGEKEEISSTGEMGSSGIPSPPPLPPPPPPPLPSPIFRHSSFHTVSLPSLVNKQSVCRLPNENNSSVLDKGKPMVTLEELQKVKLRQVSATVDKGGQPNGPL